MSLRSVLGQMKRRNMFRAATLYAATVWLLLEVVTQIFPVFGLPAVLVRTIVFVALAGFPIAMTVSWFYELTPQGLRRESAVDATESINLLTARILDRAIIVVLSLAVVLLLVNRFVSHRDTLDLPQKSIAVLPLVNESGDPDNEYFSDGLSEELIASLSQIRDLKVIGRNSAFRFKGSNTDSRTIGAMLGVANLLEGTVRRQAERVRIVVGLVNAADGHQLWSRTYDRDARDIFAVQSEIAQAVADSLKVSLLGNQPGTATEAAVSDVQAHNAYLQGHFFLERSNFESWPKAVAAFDEAIKLDPNYAIAYAERAEAWEWISTRNPSQFAQAQESARRDAQKAVQLAPTLSAAHTALGWIRFAVDWNYAGAVAALRRAEHLAPNNAKAKYRLSQVVLFQGHIEEAIDLARQAVELDPLSYNARINYGRALIANGQIEEAEAQGRKAAELQPTALASRRWQVIGAVLRGDFETALAEAEQENTQSSATGTTAGFRHFELALAHAIGDDREAADAALDLLIKEDSNSMAYQIAEVYALRNEPDKAMEWLQTSYDTRDAGTAGLLIDPLLKNVRDDPRYLAMLKKMGLSRDTVRDE